MLIYGQIKQVREAVKEWKREGKSVGFVPTMGYLHEGHKSLIDAARRENDKVVVSIFVNPMQFGPTEDLDSYPRDLNRDAKLCEDAGVDIIFHPEADEMYADGFCLLQGNQLPYLFLHHHRNILLLHLPLTFYMPPLYFLTRHIVPCYCLILVVYLLCLVNINNYL